MKDRSKIIQATYDIVFARRFKELLRQGYAKSLANYGAEQYSLGYIREKNNGKEDDLERGNNPLRKKKIKYNPESVG